ncbi:hypothetical protein [Pasteurella atlantica]|uniref:Uncharacterized protein n=2 Tax=Pasteurellaceae TaxID=712 RepID=A0ACC6HK46_9PAST|nr:hypothetical protein [Pasteurella atlantica]MDP8051245.1 hypothetical protein [Pasteurella atlantica]MDP8098922.1 hypothetical protein [Pasteurella atlantica]MDP8104540.1 hypothetical protein [Pasteurella atlantica]MDP8106949.1 hypothetical protein [Pasteurella atlantica]MDP8116639.1 hypothetical protein [Pasteurella atlantica]
MKKHIKQSFALVSLLTLTACDFHTSVITPLSSQYVDISKSLLPEKIFKGSDSQNKKQNSAKLTFEEEQEAIRQLLLNSKPNENIKSNPILQDLYIKGLVKQIDNKIHFNIPFNLHGLDCGAPDCYSSDLTFEIIATTPIQFPKKIDFTLLEHGCGIENAILKKGVFELVEASPKYVNYYSKQQNSHLVIQERAVYYFPDTKPNEIKVKSIKKIFKEGDEDKIPYQSTIMNAVYSEFEFLLN